MKLSDAKVFVNDGATFGTGGDGHIRFKLLACPTSAIEEAMDRLASCYKHSRIDKTPSERAVQGSRFMFRRFLLQWALHHGWHRKSSADRPW